ncbi:unnamed protein product [Orchesella dallaii]|uniref:Uncharacterized protein n=1 Tax=Orchesella dallaii TaxID=48710 RepID=A0ABP1Q0F2_9HEXA
MEVSGCASSQLWLTYALSDPDVPEALTLYFSMKKVFTNRKLGVFLSRKVSTSLKEALHHVFDMVFYLEDDRNTAGLSDKEFAMVSTFSLKCFEKVVFLEPTMMAIKNLDNIFNDYDEPMEFVASELGQGDVSDLPIFIARPCSHVFKDLMAALQTKNGRGVVTLLRLWAGKHAEIVSVFLDKKYSFQVSPRYDFIGCDNIVPSLANVVGISLEPNLETFGFYAQCVLKQRKHVYNECVKPLLASLIRVRNMNLSNVLHDPRSKTIFEFDLFSNN